MWRSGAVCDEQMCCEQGVSSENAGCNRDVHRIYTVPV